jgi:hypothetical protein
MMRLLVALAGIVFFPAMTVSEESVAPACVEALEQLTTLKTRSPVYKLTGDGQQQYINDADRPAAIARLQKIIDENCSANRQARSSEETEAQRLHMVRSPDCTAERDKLSLMGRPTSHESPSSVGEQRQRVIERCSVVQTPTNVWLVQVWIRPH